MAKTENVDLGDEKDFVEEIVAESTALNPDFPQLLAAASAKGSRR